MDGTTPTAAAYISSKQPPLPTAPRETLGPLIFSGYWTHMHSAAIHYHAYDGQLYLHVAGRIVGGTKCEAAAPTDIKTCLPGVWLLQIVPVVADTIFRPQKYSVDDTIWSEQMSAMFPTIAVNGNGSSLVQFAYSSAYIHTEIDINTGIDRMFIQADSLDYVSQYIGAAGPGARARVLGGRGCGRGKRGPWRVGLACLGRPLRAGGADVQGGLECSHARFAPWPRGRS
jgi:hypothetical protein